MSKTKRITALLFVILTFFGIFTITANAKTDITVSLSASSYTYDGKSHTPSVTVNYGSKKLTNNTDYTVSFASGRKNVGKYNVTVKLKGKFNGTQTKTFKIIPKATSISKISNGCSTSKVTYKSQKTQTSGYQVQYSTSSKFTNAPIKTVSDNSVTAISFSGLKIYTKYYYRVRTYKSVNGEKFYSSWSTSENGRTTIPQYDKKNAYIAVNGNKPYFSSSQKTSKKSYEKYAELDSLGRCGVCISCIGKDLMPTTERGEIGSVKPTGWQTVKYDFVDGKYLYNRCHLIGWQLTGENANRKNLITGTRYMNTKGMLPFENMIADYIKETKNHVIYRVTPIFAGNELLARGVLLEAYSIEDKGDGICFCVFCPNVQPGVTINYANGKSSSDGTKEQTTTVTKSTAKNYVLNTNTKKFHYPTCSSISQMSEKNKKCVKATRQSIINSGYSPCKNCNP